MRFERPDPGSGALNLEAGKPLIDSLGISTQSDARWMYY